jgi:ankyrin repeat protein
MEGWPDPFSSLAEKGTNEEAKDSDWNTLLVQAARDGSKETADILVNIGANKEAMDGNERTSLYLAVLTSIVRLHSSLQKDSNKNTLQPKMGRKRL